MRYRFAREGVKTVGSIAFFSTESIKWDTNRAIIVNYENDFTDPDNIVGKATDLRREDDGWLTAEIEWNDGGEAIKDDIDVSAWLTVNVANLFETEERTIENEEWLVINSCELRIIYATAGGDPWVETEQRYLCPECAQGKKINCVGKALHPVTDELVDCASTLPFEE